MAPLSTAYMHAMHIWRHRWMNSGRGRAVPIKPINATDGRSSRPEHNLLNVPLHLLRSGLHHIHCFPLKLSTVHLLPLYLNLASRFQVTVHHYNAFHYHTVHSTSFFQKKCNYMLRADKSYLRLTKFLVNNIHIYGSKIIYYENTFLFIIDRT
jgi:hypothetical protein